MNAIVERRPFTISLLLVLLAGLCFLAAFCVAEGWLSLGLWQEWIAAGLGLRILAELV